MFRFGSLRRSVPVLLCVFWIGPASADLLTWTGTAGDGLWTTAGNWDLGRTPANGDTAVIGGSVTVAGPAGNLPRATINLTGSARLTTSTDAIRLNGTTINVGSSAALAGNFWDFRDGTLNFANGSEASIDDWELKGASAFRFDLGVDGFSTLTPNFFRTDGNNTALTVAEKVALSAWTVDMAAYTGGPGVVTLVDFATDASRSGGVNGDTNDAIFQTASLNVLNNNTGLNASLRWNDGLEAVELNITSVPEPSTLAALSLLAGGLLWRQRRRGIRQ